MASVDVEIKGEIGGEGWSYLANCYLDGAYFQEITFSAKLKDENYILSIWSDNLPGYRKEHVFGVEPRKNAENADKRLIDKLKSVCYDACVSSRLSSASATDLDYEFYKDCLEDSWFEGYVRFL